MRESTRLIAESHRRFMEEVWPSIQKNDRTRMPELHELTERPVAEVVALNTKLNTKLEAESEEACETAEQIRSTALVVIVACFALAIAAAAAAGYYLLRSISRPVEALRAAAVRVGAGDLARASHCRVTSRRARTRLRPDDRGPEAAPGGLAGGGSARFHRASRIRCRTRSTIHSA